MGRDRCQPIPSGIDVVSRTGSSSYDRRLLGDRAGVDRHKLPGVMTFEHCSHPPVRVRVPSAGPLRSGRSIPETVNGQASRIKTRSVPEANFLLEDHLVPNPFGFDRPAGSKAACRCPSRHLGRRRNTQRRGHEQQEHGKAPHSATSVYSRYAVRPHRGVGLAGFLFRLETEDGVPAEPWQLTSVVPYWGAGDTIHLGKRTLRVIGKRDDDVDQPPALIVEDESAT